MIRSARSSDIQQIAKIINDYAERGAMLHRSLLELYEQLRDFHVAEIDGVVRGVVGLRVMWANLAEAYALAVAPDFRGRGIGHDLVMAALDDARRVGIRQVFALTYEQKFFLKCGFTVVNRQSLPLKVWSECVRCPKNAACDEIAVIRVLEDVEDVAPPAALSSELFRYEVPTAVNDRRLSKVQVDVAK